MKSAFTLLSIFLLLWLVYGCVNVEEVNQEIVIAPDTLSTAEKASHTSEIENELPELTYAQAKGQLVYNTYCAICHGPQGQGDGFNAYNLDPKPKSLTETDYLESVTNEWIYEMISEGGGGVKRSVLMPSYENTLTGAQIQDVVAYLRYLSLRQKSGKKL